MSFANFAFKINFLKKLCDTNGSGPDQDRCSVQPDLGPKLFAKVISRGQVSTAKERVKTKAVCVK